MKVRKPILIATLGFPGSGKTYFSERLAKKEGFLHLSSDRVRPMVFDDPKHTPEEHQQLAKIMDLIALEVLKAGRGVIYDVNFNKRIHRQRLRRLAKKAKADYVLVWIKTDINKAETRLRKRAKRKTKTDIYRPIDLKILHRMNKELEHPTQSEKHIVIDGHTHFSKQFIQYKKTVR